MSPLASETAADQASRTIIEITPEAHAELVALRDTEADADRLGLRLEVVSKPGEDFRYDLSFDVVTKAAFTDEVRTHTGADGTTLKVMVPAKDLDALTGATLDHTPTQGLIIRNPNRPAPPSVEGLISGDDLSAEVETLVATEVNPALAAHGGFVTYVGHDGEGTAYLTMGVLREWGRRWPPVRRTKGCEPSAGRRTTPWGARRRGRAVSCRRGCRPSRGR